MKYNVAMPPKEAFQREPSTAQTIIDEGSVSFIMKKIEITDKGMELHMENAKYPKKGFPFPEAIFGANQAKRLFMEVSKLAFNNKLSFLFINKKESLNFYCTAAYKSIYPFILKDEFMMPVARELKKIMTKFLTLTGYNVQFAEIVSTMVQYDDAYHYRIEDICSETQAQWLIDNPRKEILRLAQIAHDRDSNHEQGMKFIHVAKLFSILLLLPKYKSAFRQAIFSSIPTFSNLQYDEADKYWVANRSDYKYRGLSHTERMALIGERPLGVRITKQNG
jgi:hypothetical protein